MYGFSRFQHGRDKGSYYHSCFVRGDPKLVRGMIRRKIKGNAKCRKKTLSPEEEPDFYNPLAVFNQASAETFATVAAPAIEGFPLNEARAPSSSSLAAGSFAAASSRSMSPDVVSDHEDSMPLSSTSGGDNLSRAGSVAFLGSPTSLAGCYAPPAANSATTAAAVACRLQQPAAVTSSSPAAAAVTPASSYGNLDTSCVVPFPTPVGSNITVTNNNANFFAPSSGAFGNGYSAGPNQFQQKLLTSGLVHSQTKTFVGRNQLQGASLSTASSSGVIPGIANNSCFFFSNELAAAVASAPFATDMLKSNTCQHQPCASIGGDIQGLIDIDAVPVASDLCFETFADPKEGEALNADPIPQVPTSASAAGPVECAAAAMPIAPFQQHGHPITCPEQQDEQIFFLPEDLQPTPINTNAI